MTVRKKAATKSVTRVAKSAKVKLAKTTTRKAVAANTVSRSAFAQNLVPRGAAMNAPAGAMMVIAAGRPAKPGARTVTLLNRSSPAPTGRTAARATVRAPAGTAATQAAVARVKAKGTT